MSKCTVKFSGYGGSSEKDINSSDYNGTLSINNSTTGEEAVINSVKKISADTLEVDLTWEKEPEINDFFSIEDGRGDT